MQNKSSSSSTTKPKTNMLSQVVLSQYKCIKKIGEGSFGLIYKAILLPQQQQSSSNKKYAIKFESHSKRHPHLEKEYHFMKSLSHPHIPTVYTYTSIPHYNILIMDLLDKSLEDLIEIYDTFSLRTVYILLIQILSTLKYIHDNHIVHRDIKPENFVMGRKSTSMNVYIIDFGLSRLYRNEVTKQHFPLIKKKKPCGTARYASINTLNCYEQSRRDDLESLAYVCVYLIKGELPWQGIKGKTKEEKYRKLMEIKRNISEDELCKGTSKELTDFTKYVRGLQYEEEPQYDKWIEVFTNILKSKYKWNGEYTYEWSKPSSSASSDADDDDNDSKCNVI